MLGLGDHGVDGRGTSSATGTDASNRRFTYEVLQSARCHALLQERDVGRIAWTAADGPQLFPVNYTWHDNRLVFRTSPYGVMSELVRPTAVVFEVDDIDQDRRLGWSVLVRGWTSGLAAIELRRSSATTPADSWAPGVRNLVIAITPDQVTGRRFFPLGTPRTGDAEAEVPRTPHWTDGLGLNGEFP